MVKQFDTLAHLYTDLTPVKSERVRALLETSRENAFLSEQLFTLRYYQLNLKPEDLQLKKDAWLQARDFFKELEFKSLLKDFPEEPTSPEEKKTALSELYTFITVTTQEQLQELCHKITDAGACALDTETNSLSALQSELMGISVCVAEGTAYYIPVGHTTGEEQLDKKFVLDTLKPILENKSIKKYLHHAKYDFHVLAHAGIVVEGLAFDTLIAASLVTQDWQRIGLKYLSDYYFKESMLFFGDVVKKNGYKTFAQVPHRLATDYAAADAHQTFKLVPVLQKALTDYEQEDLYYTLELPLVSVLIAMEQEGIILDPAILNKLDIRVTEELIKVDRTLKGIIGEKFQILI